MRWKLQNILSALDRTVQMNSSVMYWLTNAGFHVCTFLCLKFLEAYINNCRLCGWRLQVFYILNGNASMPLPHGWKISSTAKPQVSRVSALAWAAGLTHLVRLLSSHLSPREPNSTHTQCYLSEAAIRALIKKQWDPEIPYRPENIHLLLNSVS